MQDALYNATGRLRDNLFASMQNSAGTRSVTSVLADTSPYSGMRDPVPVGRQSTIDVSHNLGRHNLAQNMDHIGLCRNLDRPTSPGLWAPKVYLFLLLNALPLHVFLYLRKLI